MGCRESSTANSQCHRSEHNACKCSMWQGGCQLKSEWMELRKLEVRWQWTAACRRGSQIHCSTVAPWLMSVVCGPLDTRLLLCCLIQPHAIKQKSHCTQGWSRRGGGGTPQPRVSSILPSRLSSPPRLSGVHALLSRHTGTQHTHHSEPRGLRCLEVNRII